MNIINLSVSSSQQVQNNAMKKTVCRKLSLHSHCHCIAIVIAKPLSLYSHLLGYLLEVALHSHLLGCWKLLLHSHLLGYLLEVVIVQPFIRLFVGSCHSTAIYQAIFMIVGSCHCTAIYQAIFTSVGSCHCIAIYQLFSRLLEVVIAQPFIRLFSFDPFHKCCLKDKPILPSIAQVLYYILQVYREYHASSALVSVSDIDTCDIQILVKTFPCIG